MRIIIDNDKNHVNYKIPTDNLWLILHIRDNRVGLVNCTAVVI